jgi:hypothetical protein
MQVVIDRQAIGLGRAHLGTDYRAPAVSESEFESYLDGTETGSLFAWFTEHAAGTPFWLPMWNNAARVTKRSTFVNGEIEVVSSQGVRVGDWLTMIGSAWFARVVSIRPGVIVVDGSTKPVEAAFKLWPNTLLLAPLRLVTFTRPSLTATWHTRACVKIQVPVVEVSTEYDLPARTDDPIGVTAHAHAWLFEFTRAGQVIERLTSHESDLTFGLHTYYSRRLEHRSITQSTSLDRDEGEFKASIDDCATLREMVSLQNEAPVFLRITQIDVGGTDAKTLFYGEITKPKLRGMVVTCRAVPGGTILDRMVPRFVVKADCNHDLYSPGCVGPPPNQRMLRANWEFTAIVTNSGAPGYPYQFVLGSLTRLIGTLPVMFRGWFAGGLISMNDGQRKAILDSTAVLGNNLTITLSGDPNPYPVAGELIHLWPGCDGRRETCRAYASTNPTGKFNNYDNFGGHPFVPLANPVLVKLNAAHSGGKK